MHSFSGYASQGNNKLPRAAPARSLMRSFLDCGVCVPSKLLVCVCVTIVGSEDNGPRVIPGCHRTNCDPLWARLTPPVV